MFISKKALIRLVAQTQHHGLAAQQAAQAAQAAAQSAQSAALSAAQAQADAATLHTAAATPTTRSLGWLGAVTVIAFGLPLAAFDVLAWTLHAEWSSDKIVSVVGAGITTIGAAVAAFVETSWATRHLGDKQDSARALGFGGLLVGAAIVLWSAVLAD